MPCGVYADFLPLAPELVPELVTEEVLPNEASSASWGYSSKANLPAKVASEKNRRTSCAGRLPGDSLRLE